MKMTFKTLLRKWHSYIGLVLLIPTTFLCITGIYLIQSSPTTALITTESCPDGKWVGVTSAEIIGTSELKKTVPFPHKSIAAISCTQSTIDVALDYGAIATTKRSKIRWTFIERPFSNKVRSISRSTNGLFVATQTSLWVYNNQQWNIIESFKPTLSQQIYELHAGWFKGTSFQWLWQITGWLWLLLSLTGVWVFIRMARR